MHRDRGGGDRLQQHDPPTVICSVALPDTDPYGLGEMLAVKVRAKCTAFTSGTINVMLVGAPIYSGGS